MAKLDPVEEPSQQQKKKVKSNHRSAKFFVFVDYLFLIFVGFLCFILFKMTGI